jgi:predicted protein tyrosine phosphatase
MGVTELEDGAIASVSRIISILDPCDDIPIALTNVGIPVLTLRFDDVVVPERGATMPNRSDVRRLLAFDKGASHDQRLLIHCTAGISRSTAALVSLLAARHPDLEDEIFWALRQIRPQAWPNSLIVALADDLLGRDGTLTEALRRYYEASLERNSVR